MRSARPAYYRLRDHLNKFNSLIAQLAIQEVAIDDETKEFLIFRSLTESLSFICIVASDQADMTLEGVQAENFNRVRDLLPE